MAVGLHCCLHMRNRANMPAAGRPAIQFKYTVRHAHAWLENSSPGRYQNGHRVNWHAWKTTLVKASTKVERTGKNVKGKTGFVLLFSPCVSVTVCLSLLLIIPETARGHWLHIWLFPPVCLSIVLHLSLSRHPFPDLPSDRLFILTLFFGLFVLHLPRLNQSIPFSFLSHICLHGWIACKGEKPKWSIRERDSRTQHLLTLQITLRDWIQL